MFLTVSNLDFNADLHLEDNGGAVIASSENTGTDNELVSRTLDANAAGESYYVRIEAKEAGQNDYTLTHATGDPPKATPVDPVDEDPPTARPPPLPTPTTSAPSATAQSAATARRWPATGPTSTSSPSTTKRKSRSGSTRRILPATTTATWK